MFLRYEYNGNIYQVEVERKNGEYYITYDGDVYTVTAEEVERGYLKINLGGRIIKCVVSHIDKSKYVFYNGDVFEVEPTELTGKKFSKDTESGEDELKSPISGRVVKIPVKEGELVKTGDELMVIEAMKMEYMIKAPWDGIVVKVNFSQGDQIDIGEESIKLSKEE
ncbi:MAG: biotin/lipoyl-containing protein [Thermoplasmata archaeon]